MFSKIWNGLLSRFDGSFWIEEESICQLMDN